MRNQDEDFPCSRPRPPVADRIRRPFPEAVSALPDWLTRQPPRCEVRVHLGDPSNPVAHGEFSPHRPTTDAPDW